jgi:hypothetical protein
MFLHRAFLCLTYYNNKFIRKSKINLVGIILCTIFTSVINYSQFKPNKMEKDLTTKQATFFLIIVVIIGILANNFI